MISIKKYRPHLKSHTSLIPGYIYSINYNNDEYIFKYHSCVRYEQFVQIYHSDEWYINGRLGGFCSPSIFIMVNETLDENRYGEKTVFKKITRFKYNNIKSLPNEIDFF